MPVIYDPFQIAGSILSVKDRSGHAIAELYLGLSLGLGRLEGLSIDGGSHGYITTEVRFYRGKDWCVSLVPNQKWIRLYIRRPELRRQRFQLADFLQAFPAAEVTGLDELALNILEVECARQVLAWLGEHL